MRTNVLSKNSVLVLNRNWQAINVITPADAFCQMMTDTATALDILGKDWMMPTKWEDWRELEVRDDDEAVGTAQGEIRVPTVIVLARFDRVPMKRPKFNTRNLWRRDRGTCQYTGRELKPGEGNIDHIMPRSRGGMTTWENCVLSDRKINSKKADRTPEEAGLKLLKRPIVPREVPVTALLRNTHEITDWNVFLKGY